MSLHSIGEAHEGGDRESEAVVYAQAYADAFLNGKAAKPNYGAVTPGMHEAYEKGRAAGLEAADRLGPSAPFVGRALLKKYGTDDDAKRA